MSGDGEAPAVRRVMFLCTGNTCRSPLAEVLARDLAKRRGLDMEFRSAGVAALEGAPASEGAEIVARRHGLDLAEHRAAQFTSSMARNVNLILAMDRVHLEIAERLAPAVPRRIITDHLPEEDPRRGQPVPDPYGGWTEHYEQAYELLEASVTGFLDERDRETGSGGG